MATRQIAGRSWHITQPERTLRHIIRSVFRILEPGEKIKFGIGVTLDFAMAMLDIAFLGLLLLLIKLFSSVGPRPSALHSTGLFSGVDIFYLMTLFFVLFALKNLLGYRVARSQYTFFYAVASRLSHRNIFQYLNSDYSGFVNTDSSVLVRRISQQPIEFSTYIFTNLQQIISQCALIIFTIAGILFYHPALFFSLFALLAPPVVLGAAMIKRKLKSIRKSIKTVSQRTLQHLNEALSGYIESNIYQKDGFFSNRYHRYQNQLNKNFALQQSLQALPPRLIEVFAVLGFLILIALNRWWAQGHGIGILDIGVFMVASYKIIPGVVKILNSAGQIKTYEFVLNDLAATPARNYTVSQAPAGVIRSFHFNEVCFDYGGRRIIDNLSFQAISGDFIGISGPSGQGKTTLINLLAGFLEENNGEIAVNSFKTTAAQRKSFRGRFSYVKQQPFIINASIRTNICLDDDDADDMKIMEVIRFCELEDFVAGLPAGLGETITENGKNISGGQRQRLMLARALYPDFDVLLLDEPFGEIDRACEQILLCRLQTLAAAGKIVLMVTHNPFSISFCNKVISLV